MGWPRHTRDWLPFRQPRAVCGARSSIKSGPERGVVVAAAAAAAASAATAAVVVVSG